MPLAKCPICQANVLMSKTGHIIQGCPHRTPNRPPVATQVVVQVLKDVRDELNGVALPTGVNPEEALLEYMRKDETFKKGVAADVAKALVPPPVAPPTSKRVPPRRPPKA